MMQKEGQQLEGPPEAGSHELNLGLSSVVADIPSSYLQLLGCRGRIRWSLDLSRVLPGMCEEGTEGKSSKRMWIKTVNASERLLTLGHEI